MVTGNPDKLATILMKKINYLEDRVKILEHCLYLDDESIERAIEEKEEYIRENSSEFKPNILDVMESAKSRELKYF